MSRNIPYTILKFLKTITINRYKKGMTAHAFLLLTI